MLFRSEAYCLTLPPIVYGADAQMKGFTIDMNLENFIDDLITKELTKKEFEESLIPDLQDISLKYAQSYLKIYIQDDIDVAYLGNSIPVAHSEKEIPEKIPDYGGSIIAWRHTATIGPDPLEQLKELGIARLGPKDKINLSNIPPKSLIVGSS